MAQRSFPVLVATDGSPQARAAVEGAIAFPWPRGSTGHGLVARATPVLTDAAPDVWDALLEVSRAEARRAERRLRHRWPDAEVFVTDAPPVPGILARARKVHARVLVLGSRGLGAVGRLLLGSVSRACVRQARSSVLVVRGTALFVTDGFPQRTWSAGDQPLAKILVGDFFIGPFRIYMSLFWFIAAAVILGYVLTQTKFGNWIQASGGNASAARARGVVVGRTKVILFALSSLLAAFAGIISSIRTSAANPNSGTGYELEVIAMVVIGGTALTGGRGTIIGTVLGVFILRVMRNGIVLIGVPGLAYNIFIGAIILGMMALHYGLERRHQAGT